MRNGQWLAVTGVLVAVLGGASGVARAQTADSTGAQKTPETQERLSQGVLGFNQASDDSYFKALMEGPDVTYDQVLTNPDDPGLNLAYARTQNRQGDFQGASVTLERLLMSHPEMDLVRLLYGLVLFRLDDTVTAQDVLAPINRANLSAEQQAELDTLLQKIALRRKRLHQSVTLTFGEHFDTDRNAEPPSGNILFGDSVFTLNGTARAQKDWGTLAMGSYMAEYDLGTDPRLSVYAGFSALSDTQAQIKTLNNQTGGLTSGLKYQDGPWSGQVGLYWNSMDLQSDYYVSDWGISGRAGYRLEDGLEAFSELRFSRQSFHDVPADTHGPENSGTVPSGWLGMTWKPVTDHAITGSVGMTSRYAAASYMSNDRVAARLGDVWLLGAGQFVSASGEWGVNVYQAPNTTISATTRRDHDMRYDLSYGVPMGTLAGMAGTTLPDEVNGIVLSATLEYYRAFSTIMNYSYSNVRTQFLVSKHWEF